MNHVGSLDAYVDGADEIDRHMHMIKGGGAALTREKLLHQSLRNLCVLLMIQNGLINLDVIFHFQ